MKENNWHYNVKQKKNQHSNAANKIECHKCDKEKIYVSVWETKMDVACDEKNCHHNVENIYCDKPSCYPSCKSFYEL